MVLSVPPWQKYASMKGVDPKFRLNQRYARQGAVAKLKGLKKD